jgi:hypothetical protein
VVGTEVSHAARAYDNRALQRFAHHFKTLNLSDSLAEQAALRRFDLRPSGYR